jgi:hypothetical protein
VQTSPAPRHGSRKPTCPLETRAGSRTDNETKISALQTIRDALGLQN